MAADANHAIKILQNIAQMNEFHDIVLVAGNDGQRFPGHRCVLAAASDYFRALLGPKIDQKEIEYPGIDGPTCRAIIDYCYTGQIEISMENVRQILAAVSGMNIVPLKQKCGDYLYRHLSVENCVTAFLHMDAHASDLRQAALDFIAINFDKIHINVLAMLNIDQFAELIRNDKISGRESFIFGRVKLWIEMKDVTEIVEKVPNLLRSIRLDCIESKFLCEEVEPFFGQQPWNHCVEMVVSEYRVRMNKTNPDCLERNPKFLHVVDQDVNGIAIIRKYYPTEDFWGTGFTLKQKPQEAYTTVIHQNEIFMIGSSLKTGLFSIQLNSLVKKTYSAFTTKTRIQTTPISAGKFIYVVGGDNYLRPLSCGERLDTENNKWERLPSMEYARSAYAAIEMNGSIYVAGGDGQFDNQSVTLNSVECFNIQNNKWTTCAPMNRGRKNFALVASDGLIYAMGGTDASVECYDPDIDVWKMIGSFPHGEKIICAIERNNEIYAFTKEKKFGKVTIMPESICWFDLLSQPTNVGGHIHLR